MTPGPWEIAIILLVLVLLFGAKKLPDAARSIGRSMRIFKSEVKEMKADDERQGQQQLEQGNPAAQQQAYQQQPYQQPGQPQAYPVQSQHPQQPAQPQGYQPPQAHQPQAQFPQQGAYDQQPVQQPQQGYPQNPNQQQ